MEPLVVVAVTAISIIIVYFFVRANKKTPEPPETVKSLIGFAQKNDSLLTRFDHVSNIVIGYSQGDHRIYFLKVINDKRVFAQVALADIVKVSLNKNSRRTSSGDNVIDAISLVFHQKDKGKHSIVLDFYNLDTDGFTFYRELALAEKWDKIISELLKS